MKKDIDLTLRLSKELKIAINLKAKSLGFSTSSYVRFLIIKDLK